MAANKPDNNHKEHTLCCTEKLEAEVRPIYSYRDIKIDIDIREGLRRTYIYYSVLHVLSSSIRYRDIKITLFRSKMSVLMSRSNE